MASLGVLAAGIAHEINNPLNFIQGGVAGIKEYFKSKPIDHESNIDFYLNAISEGVENASQIVSGLNHFSRAKVPPSDKIDIHKLIDTCLIIIGNITNYKIDIIKNFSDKPYSLSGNEGQLHQVILSILLNSVQSIDKEGSIIITTEIENNEIIVSIKDTGCGIKEEYLSKIFDPFFTTKDPGKGPGLGLSTAYIIIQEHQGTIDIQSQLGMGTTARIKLPINRIK